MYDHVKQVRRIRAKVRKTKMDLSNPDIDPLCVMQGLIPELIKSVTQDGKIAVLMMDQTQTPPDFHW